MTSDCTETTSTIQLLTTCKFHSLRKLANAIYREFFSAVKTENFDIFIILSQYIDCG